MENTGKTIFKALSGLGGAVGVTTAQIKKGADDAQKSAEEAKENAQRNESETLAYKEAQHINNAKIIGIEGKEADQQKIVDEKKQAYNKMIHGGRGNTREKRDKTLNDLQAAERALSQLSEQKQAAYDKKARYQFEIDRRTGGNK